MEISIAEAENGVVLLEVEGEVDAFTARRLEKVFKDLLAQGHVRIVVDATRMAYVSSSGLRAVLATHRELVPLGGEVRLFGLNAQVRRIFEMAGFFRLLRIGESFQEVTAEGW